jgi:hypothetical protein
MSNFSGKVDEAFEYALEKTKTSEHGVPGHYYLIDAAVRRNDSEFMKNRMFIFVLPC